MDDFKYLSSLHLDKLKGKIVLITGVNGFIASYLARFLLSIKVRVIGLGRQSSNIKDPNFQIIIQDVCDPISKKADYIIHAASKASPIYYGTQPVDVMKPNIIGTYNLL